MEAIIRKISIGSGFPDKCMHYQVGRPINKHRSDVIVSEIIPLEENGIKVYTVFVHKNNTSIFWKKVEGMPVVVENDIDFQ